PMSDRSRRDFLGRLAALAAAPALPGALRAADDDGPRVFGKPVGLQLYSLRERMPKDVPGTLAAIRAMGFREVEGGGDYKLGTAGFLAELKKAGLSVTSALYGYEDWGKDKGAGIRFVYHIHGYEFQPSPEGTLLDTLAKETDPAAVAIEADIFWVRRGGCDPVALFEKYPGRIPLTHVKDIAKGVEVCKPNGSAPDETSVPIGAGMIDWPVVFKAAEKAGVERHFIEDEHPEAERQIPVSLRYLAQF